MQVDSNCAVDMLLQSAIDVSLFAKDAEDILEKDMKRAILNFSNFANFNSCPLYYCLHLKKFEERERERERERKRMHVLKYYCS